MTAKKTSIGTMSFQWNGDERDLLERELILRKKTDARATLSTLIRERIGFSELREKHKRTRA
jgi:hypothetical protein